MEPEQVLVTHSKELDKIINEFWWNYIRLGGQDLDWFYLHIGPLVTLRNRAMRSGW